MAKTTAKTKKPVTPKAEKPAKVKAEKPAKVKAEKPAKETTTKTETKKPGSDEIQTPKQKTITIWQILLKGKQQKHGKFVTDKTKNVQNFVPATELELCELCESNGIEVETDEDIVKALNSLGL